MKYNNHTKLVLTNYGGVTGGRNITGSEFSDISFKVTKQESINKLKKYFERIWNN